MLEKNDMNVPGLEWDLKRIDMMLDTTTYMAIE